MNLIYEVIIDAGKVGIKTFVVAFAIFLVKACIALPEPSNPAEEETGFGSDIESTSMIDYCDYTDVHLASLKGKLDKDVFIIS